MGLYEGGREPPVPSAGDEGPTVGEGGRWRRGSNLVRCRSLASVALVAPSARPIGLLLRGIRGVQPHEREQ